MKVEKLDRGYVTNMLTNEKGEIYGMMTNHNIDFFTEKTMHDFYWSEVYVEPNHFAQVIRRGIFLGFENPDKLREYFEQSKVNFKGE